ncbi:hypothetical protein [Sphingomonas oligoaromativorans]|uniref:hypothetical protein n=1 Tax=Sphingomonas oligoaromativorans TaxID=575322 RepID=UPI00142032EA|nr:hypothetical protein [Sphingomonas oligoaromativorans]NIJ34348.1 hypothetical protein [Sphingomonas oligoaromativorans]
MSGIANLVPGVSQAKAIAAAVGLVAFAVPIAGWAITAHTLASVRDWQASVVSSTSTALHVVDKAGRPHLLAANDVPAAIAGLGDALDQVRLKTARAQADDAAHAKAVKNVQDLTTKEHDNGLQAQLDDARSRVADYARRMRGAASAGPIDQRGSGTSGMSAAADAAQVADGSGATALVPVPQSDLDTCAANTVRLEDAVKWIADQGAIPN